MDLDLENFALPYEESHTNFLCSFVKDFKKIIHMHLKNPLNLILPPCTQDGPFLFNTVI